MTVTRELLDKKYIRRLIRIALDALKPDYYTKLEIEDRLDLVYGMIAGHTHNTIDGGNA